MATAVTAYPGLFNSHKEKNTWSNASIQAMGFQVSNLLESCSLPFCFLSFFNRETHPPSFKLDLFIRNLDRPSDVVFERLGQ